MLASSGGSDRDSAVLICDSALLVCDSALEVFCSFLFIYACLCDSFAYSLDLAYTLFFIFPNHYCFEIFYPILFVLHSHYCSYLHSYG